MAIEIVDFPIKNGGSFHSKPLVYQRVFQLGPSSNFIDRFLFNGSRISGGVGNHKPAWEARKKALRNPYWKSAHPESRTTP